MLVPDVAGSLPPPGCSLAAGEPFLTGAPDLAVEVVSPDDSLAVLTRKAQRYLDAGSRLVWVVDPQRRPGHRAPPRWHDRAYHPDGGGLSGGTYLLGLEDPLATLGMRTTPGRPGRSAHAACSNRRRIKQKASSVASSHRAIT